MKLPTLNGFEVYLRIKEINPKAKAVITTAYKDEMKDLVKAAPKGGVYACLTKPLDMDEVLGLIKEISQKTEKEK